MNLEHYNYYSRDDHKAYEFYSEGPKGIIAKLVLFIKIPDTEPPFYNLAFGDKNPITEGLDDKVKSNNNDRDIVLATVANTIIEFSNHYDNPYIYVEGSTPARTRLYQMGIAGLWDEISTDFDVLGLCNDQWSKFKPNTLNYEAFLFKRR